MSWDISRTVEYYDSIAKTYDERSYSPTSATDYPANYFRLQIAKEILSDIPKSRLLDAGCGTAQFLAHAVLEGFDCVGVDFSAGMLQGAQRNLGPDLLGRVRLIQGPIHDLCDLDDSSFDAVFTLGVFSYIPNYLEARSYRELRRVLKPGGIFVSAHQNELFDLFTFNKYTLRFFESNVYPLLAANGLTAPLDELTESLKTLITHPDEPVNTDPERSGRDIIFNHPENPITYGDKIREYGFRARDTCYYHFHALPPLLRNESHLLLDASKRLEVHAARCWQGMFMASGFVSVAEAVE